MGIETTKKGLGRGERQSWVSVRYLIALCVCVRVGVRSCVCFLKKKNLSTDTGLKDPFILSHVSLGLQCQAEREK